MPAELTSAAGSDLLPDPLSTHLLTPSLARPPRPQKLPDLLARPPPLPLAGALRLCFGYLAPVFLLSDGEFVQTAGLDALVCGRPRLGSWWWLCL